MNGEYPGNIFDLFKYYTELRVQENRTTFIETINSQLIKNSFIKRGGVSARVQKNGVYGFNSETKYDTRSIKKVIKNASENAEFLSNCSKSNQIPANDKPLKIKKDYRTKKKKLSEKEKIEYLMYLNDFIKSEFPKVISYNLFLRDQEIEKHIFTSSRTEIIDVYTRSHIYCSLSLENDGVKYEIYDAFGNRGNFEDVFSSPLELSEKLYIQYEHLIKKGEGIYPKAGLKNVIIDSSISGIVAHEAIGHTVEADLVKSGSVGGDLLNKKICSEKINITDFANSYKDELLPVPVFIDDEGSEAQDVHLIENGILKNFMHNQKTAFEFNTSALGNARGFYFNSEPLIRMRNTAILPGEDSLEEMINSIEDGYYLMKTSNGEADSTSEFMFGIIQGYEIKNGKLGCGLKDFTVSGIAFDLLKTVSMTSDKICWDNSGYCGKKQPMIVSYGAPAIKCKMNIGGKL